MKSLITLENEGEDTFEKKYYGYDREDVENTDWNEEFQTALQKLGLGKIRHYQKFQSIFVQL
eukprot:TRINITY_DN5706_c0_g1_i1.p2 TRINITY_DN5706_c0_g1~~TRINITY_DN5706_c0_g1_i1.p2  ORF type:complete len:62 (-),score=12.19 TRINITY_DN5706_c0_g1_i1:159-344(-)